MDEPAQSDELIRIGKQHAAGVVTLDRPRALNALSDDMRAHIAGALPDFARDPIVYCMVIRSATERAFCAGGDVRELVGIAKDDPALALQSFGFEYALDWQLECFSKPTVSLIDGMVMGSGVGLTLFGTHRVAGPRYSFAMPECAIGLFPDVGVCHHLARLPDEIGTYLALTGARIGRGDAMALGLATHAVPSTALEPIVERLADADPVDALLDDFAEDAGPLELLEFRDAIAEWFAGDDVRAIRERLASATAQGGKLAEFASNAAAALDQAAPLSLVVTLRHLRDVARKDLRDTLKQDYRLAAGFLAGHDFAEGVRAQLIDKDRAPKWQPATLDEAAETNLDSYFAAPGDGDLDLPTREELQRI
ncbi:MAG: enoyl-CoA hydratase/isomerase family protein [Pseudomonadota bacterium]